MTKRFLSPRVLWGRPRQRAGRALPLHIFNEVQMKSPYFKAVDNRTGKTLVKARDIANLIAVFDYAVPPTIDIYEVRERKIA